VKVSTPSGAVLAALFTCSLPQPAITSAPAVSIIPAAPSAAILGILT
jgi:hypothetical protein